MSTLTVNATNNYSHTVLSNITLIDFTTFPVGSATFLATQFNGVQISTSVAIDGSTGLNSVIVNDATSFSAANWTFSNWQTTDRVTINGTIGNNALVGSSKVDVISGNDGADKITGGKGADNLSGGAGNDSFALTSANDLDTNVTETISGGADTDTVIFTGTYGALELSHLLLTSVERLAFGSGGASVSLSQTYFETPDGFTTIDFSGGVGSLSIGVTGFDLSTVTITGFTVGSDSLNIIPTTLGGTYVGTDIGENITVAVAAGFGSTAFSTVDGRAGDDRFLMSSFDYTGQLIGGTGIDSLVFQSEAVADLSAAALDGIERLELQATSNFNQITISASQIDAGLTTFVGSAVLDFLDINMVAGQELDLSGLTLINWLSDRVVVAGTTSDDRVIGGASNIHANGGDGNDMLQGASLADSLTGGAGDDTLVGLGGGDTLEGDDGDDTVDYRASALGVAVDLATGTNSGGDAQGDVLTDIENLLGSQQADSFVGNAGFNLMRAFGGNDFVTGADGRDTLDGGQGKDTLDGGTGFDSLTGGKGKDVLTGGADSDLFLFLTAQDSGLGIAADRITDFTLGVDRIVLTAIDAIAGGSNDAFSFVTGTFTAEGQVSVETRGANTVVMLNLDADTDAEAEIVLTGHVVLTATDFNL